GGWPLFGIRDDTGAVHALRNVCRHQGLPILDLGGGHCAALRCRYHGWSYARDGAFASAPPMVTPADPKDPMHRLPALPTLQRDTLLFVYPGQGAAPSAVKLKEMPSLAGLAFREELAVDIEANWKMVMEHCLGRDDDAEGRRHWLWPSLVIERRS